MNLWLKDYCRREGFSFVDYYAAMADSNGQLPADQADDGLHPNAKGYRDHVPCGAAGDRPCACGTAASARSSPAATKAALRVPSGSPSKLEPCFGKSSCALSLIWLVLLVSRYTFGGLGAIMLFDRRHCDRANSDTLAATVRSDFCVSESTPPALNLLKTRR